MFLAASVNEGIEILYRQRLDLVITDLLMPERDGIELIATICSEFPSLKFVAMSGGGKLPANKNLTAAELAGADLVLEKPVNWNNR